MPNAMRDLRVALFLADHFARYAEPFRVDPERFTLKGMPNKRKRKRGRRYAG